MSLVRARREMVTQRRRALWRMDTEIYIARRQSQHTAVVARICTQSVRVRHVSDFHSAQYRENIEAYGNGSILRHNPVINKSRFDRDSRRDASAACKVAAIGIGDFSRNLNVHSIKFYENPFRGPRIAVIRETETVTALAPTWQNAHF
jgi:uncharacterized protein YdiU (UPF0061 family)